MIVALGVIAAVMTVWTWGEPRFVTVATTRPASRESSALKRLRAPLSVLACAAGWAYLGGVIGIGAGIAAGFWAWRTLGRATSPAEVRREALLRNDYPLVIELMSGALNAGSDVRSALGEVAAAVGDPWQGRMSMWLNALEIGQSPLAVWKSVEQDPLAMGLGRVLTRAHATGVPVADALTRLAQDVREEAELAALAAARTIEVRAAAPLGVCFLPAFVLLGVVPLVAGVLRGMTWVSGS